MKLLPIKALILLLCVPMYPIIVVFYFFDRGGESFLVISREYWKDVREALTYKEAEYWSKY